ncbi:MAG: NAD(P)-dependent alcohol dehydrogenase [Pyrinomonadaceae bacterium]
MKAYEITSFGMDGLQQVERDVPVPQPGEVQIKLAAGSLNFRDLMVLRGDYNPRLPLPATPLSDGVGYVTELGAGVTSVAVGDRVAITFFENWVSGDLSDAGARNNYGAGGKGNLAQFVCINQSGLVHVPEHLTDDEAATLPCAAVTAWNALFEQSRTRPGDTVLVLGTGGVSLFALQFGTMAGAQVIVTSSSDEKLARATEMGAAATINYRENPDWEKQIRKFTEGLGVDQVIEVGGAGTLGRSVKSVRRGGTISLIGALTGSGTLDPTPVFMRGIRLNGIFVGSRAMFEQMNQAIDQRKLRPIVDRIFEFDDVRSAFEHMASGNHFGKIAIRF